MPFSLCQRVLWSLPRRRSFPRDPYIVSWCLFPDSTWTFSPEIVSGTQKANLNPGKRGISKSQGTSWVRVSCFLFCTHFMPTLVSFHLHQMQQQSACNPHAIDCSSNETEDNRRGTFLFCDILLHFRLPSFALHHEISQNPWDVIPFSPINLFGPLLQTFHVCWDWFFSLITDRLCRSHFDTWVSVSQSACFSPVLFVSIHLMSITRRETTSFLQTAWHLRYFLFISCHDEHLYLDFPVGHQNQR